MSQYPTPNQPYFPGINYNPSFFTSSSGVSLQYATNNFLQRTGTNPTSIATLTTFSGSINVNSLTTTTDSSIGGNLSVSKNINLNNVTSAIYAPTIIATATSTLAGTVIINPASGGTAGTIFLSNGNGQFDNSVTCNQYYMNPSNAGTNPVKHMVFGADESVKNTGYTFYMNGNTVVANNLGIQTKTPTFALDVSGGIHTNKNLYVEGNIGLGKTVNPYYTLDISGTLRSTGDITTYGTITANQTTSGNLNVSYDATVNGNTTVNGNIVIVNNLKTIGTSNLNGDTTINGNLIVNTQLTVNDDTTINGLLTAYDLNVPGIIHSGYNVYVDGQCGIATTTPTYDLDVSGIINTNSDLYVKEKIGIGTTSPSYPLDVSGTVRLGTPTSNIVIYPDWIYGSTGSWINMPTGTSGIGTGIGRNAWMASVSNYTDWVNDSVPGDIISRNLDGRILFSCNNSYAQISLSSSSLIIGNSSNYLTTGIYGSLGIGKTTPSYPLDVVGDIQASGDFRMANKSSLYAKNSTGTYLSIFTPCWDDNITYFAYGSAGMNIRNSSYGSTMFLNSSNQVGIGTTSPAYPLDVVGDIRTSANFRMPNQGIIYAKNVAGAYIPVFFPCWSDNITYINYGSAGWNIRNSGSVNTMFLNNSNQVGIRTTTPSYPLDVSGIINSNTSIQSQIYNFNYSTIPTLTTTSLGYATTATYASLPLTPASSSAYAITFTSLPIGVYLIQAYAIGTFITTALTNIKLGLNTTATAPTANNYTQQILPILSTTTVQSINYSYYLSNSSVTTYYIVFATGASFGTSSVTSFNANFIRIA